MSEEISFRFILLWMTPDQYRPSCHVRHWRQWPGRIRDQLWLPGSVIRSPRGIACLCSTMASHQDGNMQRSKRSWRTTTSENGAHKRFCPTRVDEEPHHTICSALSSLSELLGTHGPCASQHLGRVLSGPTKPRVLPSSQPHTHPRTQTPRSNQQNTAADQCLAPTILHTVCTPTRVSVSRFAC